jgi:sigma-B regulation protein RsbU (phosphoserine phosphatase)
MPAAFPTLPGMSFAGECRPVSSVGGDYFDVFTMGSKIGICIADVIGKGVPAALMMANLQAAVKVTAAEYVDPADLCRRLNKIVYRNGAADKFISFFYAALDPEKRKLTYSNCGHNPPVLIDAHGAISRLRMGGTLLGVRADEPYCEQEINLHAGDRVILFTDGLSEAGTAREDEYGEQRLMEFLRHRQAGEPAAELLKQVLHDVSRHCHGEFEDDLTCVVLSLDVNAVAGEWSVTRRSVAG